MKKTCLLGNVYVYHKQTLFHSCTNKESIHVLDKKAIMYILVFFLLCAVNCLAVSESDLSSVSSYYVYSELDDGTIQIDKYLGPATENIMIPDTIDGKKVTSIGDYAFYDCSRLTGHLAIPDGITYIGEHAFENCNGFTGSLIIPSSVSNVASYAFYNCTGFNGGLVIQNGVKTIGDYAFYNCYGFTGGLVVPTSVINIGYNSFFPCDGFIGRIVCQKTAKDGSYYTCTCIALYCSENSAASIWAKNSSDFEQSPLNCIAKVGSLATSDYTYTNLGDGTIRIDSYIGPSNADNIIIPDYIDGKPVTVIGEYAFDSQSNLTGTLIIPDTIKHISFCSFALCSKLSEIIIGNKVESIGNNAFAFCSNLSSLYIPNTVSYIGNLFLDHCCSLETIIVDPENTSFCSSDGVLFDKTRTTLIYYPINKKDATYYVPSTVRFIAEMAFMDNACVENVILPDTLSSLGEGAFVNCSTLKSINIPGSIAEIPSYAFESCFNLSTVILSNGITKIASYAFRWCSILNNLQIPEGIDLRSFYHIHNGVLYEISLPYSIESVDVTAFDFTPAGSIIEPDFILPPYTIEPEAFAGINAKYIYIPMSVYSIEERAFADCENLKFVFFGADPSSFINIEEDAFDSTNTIYFIHSYNQIISEYLRNHNYVFIPSIEEEGNG